MNPETVARQQVGDLGDGQGKIAALDVHIDLGAKEIEHRPISIQRWRNQQAKQKQREQETAPHMSIVRIRASEVSRCIDFRVQAIKMGSWNT
jgi:hypothetical protein